MARLGRTVMTAGAAGNTVLRTWNGDGSAEVGVAIAMDIEVGVGLDVGVGVGVRLGHDEDPRRYVEQTAPGPSRRMIASVCRSSVGPEGRLSISTLVLEALITGPSAAWTRTLRAKCARCPSRGDPAVGLRGEVDAMRFPKGLAGDRRVLWALGALACAAAIALACGDSSSNGSSGGTSGTSGTSGTTGGTSGTSGTTGGTSGASGTTGDASGTSGSVPGPGTMYAGCRIFPNDNPWNSAVDTAPLDTELMASVMPGMALGTGLHPDWGTATDNYGIPITVGKAAAPAPITWNTSYGPNESDPLACAQGPFCYPIPLDAKIEGGPGAKSSSDRHVIFLATDAAPDHCVLYELYNTQNPSNGGFTAASGAIWKLDSNAMRTEGWTSADAAGLPVLAGLVRLEEIKRGEITHAIRFTMDSSQQAYIHPATHAAGDANPALPPMGLRLRLKASFNDSAFTGASKVISTAMKKYGVMLADNGSNWYISGETEDGWAPEMDALLSNLGKVKGGDFEIVKTGPVIIAAP